MFFSVGLTGGAASGAFAGLAALLAVFVLMVLFAVFIYLRPAFIFKSNNVPFWKAFVPVYNMWKVYSLIGKKAVFTGWLIISIPRTVLLILTQFNEMYRNWFSITYLITMIPLAVLWYKLESVCDDGAILRIYDVFVFDLYAIAGIAIPIMLLFY